MDTGTDVSPAAAITPESTVVGEGPVATVHAVDGSAVKVFRDGVVPGEQPPAHAAVVAETDRGTIADDDGLTRAYVASAFARRSLAELVADVSKRSWHETTVLGVRLAGALAAAHEAGVAHGGVKPTNVLVTDADDDATASARLGDFAHGSWRVAASSPVSDGAVLGFCAPEVLEGSEPDAAADVYSLGATLHFALSGEVPFAPAGDETLMRTLRRILSEPVTDVRPLRVPDDLAGVIETAMAKEPGDRFASAAALGEALQAVQRAHGHSVTPLDTGAPASDPHTAADVTAPELASTPPPRRRSTTGRAWVLGVLVACAVLAVAVVVLLAVRSKPPRAGESVAATHAPPTAASTPPTTAVPTTAAPTDGAADLPRGADASVFPDVPGYHLTDQAEDSVVSEPALAESILQKANLALVRTDDGRQVGAFLVLVLQDRIAGDPDALTKIVEAIAPDPPTPPDTVEIAGQTMIVTTTPDGLTAIAGQDPSGLIVGILRGSDRALMEQFLTALGGVAQ